jgi:diguanylate cyclase (GGDEF)-like protein
VIGLNIRQKILLSFLFVMLVSGGAIFIIYNNSSRITRLTNVIINEDLKNILSAEKMLQILLHSDWALTKYQLTRILSWRDTVYDTQRVFKTLYYDFNRNVSRDTEKSLLAEINANHRQYSSQIRNQIRWLEQGLIDGKAQENLRGQENTLTKIIENLQQLISLNAGRLEERLAQAKAIKQINASLSIAVVTVVTLISVLLIFLLNQTIIGPINRLMDGVRRFSDGNFTTQVPVVSQDEIGELSAAFNVMATKIKNDRQKLTVLTIQDEKTGLFNFRHFKSAIQEELKRAERYDRHLSLIMIDIDYFKHYNDTNGHPMGDLLLKELALILKESVRETDLLARFGGEEFIILLPETTRAHAQKIAENLRLRIKNHVFPLEEKQPGKDLTVSLGVASFPSKNVVSPDTLIERADQALYRAKNRGRNRVCVA